MQKLCIRVLGVFTTATSLLCADGFSEQSKELIAGKDVFPGDDEDEAVLPQMEMDNSEDSDEDNKTEEDEESEENSDDYSSSQGDQ